MTELPRASVLGICHVLYDWMLERGYMYDPDDGAEPVADKVEMWDAVDLLNRLEVDGFVVTERSASSGLGAQLAGVVE